MRLGCGCLVLSLGALALLIGGWWIVGQALARPDFSVSLATPEDGRRAQAKIQQIISRSSRGARADRGASIVLTESELNAFVAYHLVEVGGMPVSDLSLRLPAERAVEIAGRLPLGHLVSASVLEPLSGFLHDAWKQRRVWVTLGGEVRVERRAPGARRIALEVKRFALGRQDLPAFLARLVLDPAAIRWLRWTLPSGVEDVTIETGRVVIRPGG